MLTKPLGGTNHPPNELKAIAGVTLHVNQGELMPFELRGMDAALMIVFLETRLSILIWSS
jgi:hypothetical protein